MPFYRLTATADKFFHATIEADSATDALQKAGDLTEWDEGGPYPDIVDIDHIDLIHTRPRHALTEHTRGHP